MFIDVPRGLQIHLYNENWVGHGSGSSLDPFSACCSSCSTMAIKLPIVSRFFSSHLLTLRRTSPWGLQFKKEKDLL